jgi:polar amino acid transport system permease protein
MWDWASFLHYIHSPYLLTGAAISLGLSVGAMLIGLIFGVIAAMMRMSERRWLRLPASGYVWLFRGTPVLVQLIIIYTGLPQLGIQLGVVASALIGLGLNEGAYLAEIIRSGSWPCPRASSGRARHRHDRPKTMRVGHATGAAHHHSAARQRLQRPDEDLFARLVISLEELLRRTELLVRCSSRSWKSSWWRPSIIWCSPRCGA